MLTNKLFTTRISTEYDRPLETTASKNMSSHAGLLAELAELKAELKKKVEVVIKSKDEEIALLTAKATSERGAPNVDEEGITYDGENVKQEDTDDENEFRGVAIGSKYGFSYNSNPVESTTPLVTTPTPHLVTPVKNEEEALGGCSGNPSRKRKADTEASVEGEVIPVSTDPLVTFNVNAMPSSIGGIIHLMDVLQPNRQYYSRQEDSRGECSKMRGKLRKYANANEDKLGVAHWVETKNWKPPSNEALSALMVLIRDMIDKSWPLN